MDFDGVQADAALGKCSNPCEGRRVVEMQREIEQPRTGAQQQEAEASSTDSLCCRVEPCRVWPISSEMTSVRKISSSTWTR